MAAPSHRFVFFGHHKCASSWTRNILTRGCKALGIGCVRVNQHSPFLNDVSGYLKKENVRFIFCANEGYRHLDSFAPFKGFHMIRDPRDIIVSSYFSHLHSHPTDKWPELEVHRRDLEKLSEEEGLLAEMDCRKKDFRLMREWDYSRPDVLELKMENVTADPCGSFIRIFDFMGLLEMEPAGLRTQWRRVWKQTGLRLVSKLTGRKIYPAQLSIMKILEIVKKNDFTVKSGGRMPGTEDLNSHYRKGIAGDWKNHFTPFHKDAFKKNFGDLLIRLGYEKDNSW